jgi:hypothetical protein
VSETRVKEALEITPSALETVNGAVDGIERAVRSAKPNMPGFAEERITHLVYVIRTTLQAGVELVKGESA